MICIENSRFEYIKCTDFNGIITDLGDNEIHIEYSKFYEVCSVCAGAIYKKNGLLKLNRVCFDFCSTTRSGNNAGSSILYGISTSANFTKCSISHSSYKSPQQSIDSPFYLEYNGKNLLSMTNFSHNNGNSNLGNIFMETSWAETSITEYSNFANGTADLLAHYYQPKQENYFRRCNVIDTKTRYLIAGISKNVYVSECAFFRNANAIFDSYAKLDNCWSDNAAYCTKVSTFTYLSNEVGNNDCTQHIKDQQYNNQKNPFWCLVISYFLK